MAGFLAIQMARGRAFCEQWRDMHRQLAQRLGQDFGAELDVTMLTEQAQAQMTDAVAGRECARFMVEAMRNFTPMLLAKDWLLFQPTAGSTLVIGDNPIALQNQTYHQGPMFSNLGLGVPGIEIYCPLAPDLALALYSPTIMNDAITREVDIDDRHRGGHPAPMLAPVYAAEQCQRAMLHELLTAWRGGRVIQHAPEHTLNLQYLQVHASERFVFEPTETSRSLRTSWPNSRTSRPDHG